MSSKKSIVLDQGSGGKASQRLISDLFLKYFANETLKNLDDAALLPLQGPIAMSTDTFTVDPLIFPGGNIGTLAVHGTVNDVAMLGARPEFLSCAFVLEEGLDFDILEEIVSSMADAARQAEVEIVTGDTKVVPKSAVDKVFINTTGIGRILANNPPQGHRASPGDAILLSGTAGDHGLCILSKREGLAFESPVQSDSAALNHIVQELLQKVPEIHVLRDPTRGGLATTLNEIAIQSGVQFQLREGDIPVQSAVKEGCSFLGLDPFYLANEGKFICILPQEYANPALEVMHKYKEAAQACQIGTVHAGHPGRVVLETKLGGKRLLDMLEGEQLPRIC